MQMQRVSQFPDNDVPHKVNIMNQVVQTLNRFIERIIEPHPQIVDPEARQQSQTINSLLVIYIPLAIFVVLFRFLVMPDDVTTTLQISGAGILVVSLIYLVSKAGYYRASIFVTILLGYGIIYWNAVNSSAPHFEISYLIFIPLLGIVLFSVREAIVNYGIVTVLLVIYLITTDDMTKGVSIDLFVFMLLTQGFVLFATYQRGRLDIYRRELAIEKEKSALIRELVDNLSHDFKTPLSIIQTSLYLLRRAETAEKREDKLQRIEQQAKRLDVMLQDLLAISKLDHDTLPEFARVDFVQVVKAVSQDLCLSARMKNIKLKQKYEIGEGIHIMGHVEDLERMILNLLQNALTYTGEGGHIVISVSRKEGFVQLEIEDTGIGMKPEEMKQIFDRFYRADKARSSHTGGNGLGLAIVKRIVECHNGIINVESQFGMGTKFIVSLPLTPDETREVRPFPFAMQAMSTGCTQ